MGEKLIDLAFEFVNGKKKNELVSFEEIWDYVKTKAGLSNEEANQKVGQFYTYFTLDGRFVFINDTQTKEEEKKTSSKGGRGKKEEIIETNENIGNTAGWAIKAKRKFSDWHKNASSFYSEDDSNNDDTDPDDKEDNIHENSENSNDNDENANN